MISEQEMGPAPKQEAPKITGYRNLTDDEIALINETKAMAVKVGELCDKIAKSSPVIDQRWVAIGRTDLQRGFMAVIRGIARPETF